MYEKVFYLDTETTGLDPNLNEIIQIAGDVCGETFNFKCRPLKDTVAPEALKSNGFTLEEIRAFPHPSQAFQGLIEVLSRHVNPYDSRDKLRLIGYNIGFDLSMLMSFFDTHSPLKPFEDLKFPKKYYLGNFVDKQQCVCVWRTYLFAVDMGLFPRQKSYKLSELTKIHSIPHTPHDAASDIEATKILYDIIKKRFFECGLNQELINKIK
jgi:DNA polymerase III epsilon subunit-like protein